jgi:hypothetical protein
VGKIKHKGGSSYLREWEFLKTLLPADHVKYAKLTLPAPEWYHLRYETGCAYPKDVYANEYVSLEEVWRCDEYADHTQ